MIATLGETFPSFLLVMVQDISNDVVAEFMDSTKRLMALNNTLRMLSLEIAMLDSLGKKQQQNNNKTTTKQQNNKTKTTTNNKINNILNRQTPSATVLLLKKATHYNMPYERPELVRNFLPAKKENFQLISTREEIHFPEITCPCESDINLAVAMHRTEVRITFFG